MESECTERIYVSLSLILKFHEITKNMYFCYLSTRLSIPTSTGNVNSIINGPEILKNFWNIGRDRMRQSQNVHNDSTTTGLLGNLNLAPDCTYMYLHESSPRHIGQRKIEILQNRYFGK